MKKNLFISLLISLTLFACTKESVSPLPKVSTISNTTGAKQIFAGDCYIISNLETNWGVVEYRVRYTDCNGILQNVALGMGKSIQVCLNDPANVRTNFAYSIKPCTTPIL